MDPWQLAQSLILVAAGAAVTLTADVFRSRRERKTKEQERELARHEARRKEAREIAQKVYDTLAAMWDELRELPREERRAYRRSHEFDMRTIRQLRYWAKTIPDDQIRDVIPQGIYVLMSLDELPEDLFDMPANHMQLDVVNGMMNAVAAFLRGGAVDVAETQWLQARIKAIVPDSMRRPPHN